MANKKVVNFIKEARKRGFGDSDLRKALLNHGWPLQEIEKAFIFLQPKYKFKNQVCIFLGNDVLDVLEKRAKKNMFTVSEQIEDILRRSCVGLKKTSKMKKCDDLLVSIFSRERTGPKK